MRKIGLIFGLALLLVSCAVVNVYVTFPQEKLDKAMEGLELQVQPAAPSLVVPKKQSRLSPWRFLEPAPLYAETTVITSEVKTTSSVIDEAQARRRGRLSDIQGYKDNKILGENNQGLLDVRSTAGLDGKQVSSLQKMVKEENSDRMTIYRETVKINNMPSAQIKNVQAASAKAKQKLANDGEWIQNENGAWQVKESEIKK
ncbi:MAG: YdbL family protein [Candidatus Omnitrophica bacterium]|nr:YdbL family protein [Candidatus Omnitrophota bacterium]